MSNSRAGRSRHLSCLLLLALAFLSRLSPAAEIPYEWKGVQRIVAVADVHGDYERFVFILSHPEVGLVDGDLRWIGGRTHFVQLGDVMDRGPEARRIFELVMRLEKEAAAAGGMVHQLIGNHEEMNITGIALDYPGYVTLEQFLSFLPADYRRKKEAEYLRTLPDAERRRAEVDGLDPVFDEGLASFWQRILARRNPEASRAYVLGFNDAVGNWLITKNTIIKINEVVYCHGGISEAYSKWPLREINTVMRSELEFFQGRMRNPQDYSRPFKPRIVYEPDSPLWFRGLATKNEDSAQAEVDRTLANLGARAMVIGHNFFRFNGGTSPILDRRSVARFQDKVWIMDTGISGSYGGIPSALICEGGEVRVWGETEEVAARSGVRLPVPKLLAPKEMETFLKTAEIVGREPGPGGRTDAWKLDLEARGLVLAALFKYIDRRRPDPLADSYRYDLAAYALNKYLGLGIVPPIVERTVNEVPGGLQAFVPKAVSEADRKAKHVAPEDPAYHDRVMADLTVFQNLVYDDCENENDTLIGGDGRIYRVDFSESFVPKTSLPPHCAIRKCSRLLYRKLRAWDDKTVAGYVGRHLNKEETAALLARRKIVLRLLDTMIKAMGESTVLF